MNKNPAVQISQQLNDKDYVAVRKLLTKDKRSASLKLFTIIRAYRKKELTKEILFEKLYGEPYMADKDYLLRNDLRLLRQKLDKYLLSTAIETLLDEDEIFRQKMTLYAYKHNKLYDLFYDNYDKTEQLTLESLQFDQALFIQNWYLDLAYQHQFSEVKDYEEKMNFFRETGAKFKKTLNQYLATQIRMQQFYQAMEGYYHTLLHKDHVVPELDAKSISFQITEYEHPLSNYYHNRAKGFYTNVEGRLTHFLQAYQSLKDHQPTDKYITDLLVTVLLGIGRCLQQLGDFKRADEYLNRAMTDYAKELPSIASRDKLYANYLVNLLNIGKYQKVLDFLKGMDDEVKGEAYLKYWYSIYKLIAYIGLNKTKEIRNSLPANYGDIPLQHRIYFRIINSIYYYLIGENEWAYRETYNLLHTKLADDYGKDQKQITGLLETFLQLNDKYARKKNIPVKEQKKLREDVEKVDTKLINDINILPIFLWLKNECNS